MKKVLFIPILLVFIFSCSPDEETQAPTNNVQYTLSITAGEGGSVTDGGTFDEGSDVTITATPDEGYQFVGWDNGIPDAYDINLTGSISINGIELDSNDYNIENTNILIGQYTRKPIENGYDQVEIFYENEQLRWRNEAGVSWSLELRDGKLWGGGAAGYSEQVLGVFKDNDQNILGLVFDNLNYINNLYESLFLNLTSESLTVTLNSNITLNAIFKEEYNYEYNQLDLNEPPFYGTNSVSGDIITSSDPSLFSEIEYKGTGQREMFDRRNGGSFNNVEPHLFDTSFSDGLKTEIQVNPEFTLDEATVEANKYAFLIGQLPTALRKDVETMWIHKGIEVYGGGNNNLLVHTGYTEIYESYIFNGSDNSDYIASVVEETLLHEATHTSIDSYHYPNGGWTNSGYSDGERWINAVENDNECYISTYARDFPYREDLAELMPLYVAV